VIASCDIFCRVVDNLGDAGVCWRLARQLAVEHDLAVTLWMDRPAALDRFVLPESADQALRDLGRICVRDWTHQAEFARTADLVIETFGCDVPAAYAEALAARRRPVHWYNLEYLSAEDWVVGCHGLPSPHPRLPLSRIFFFPGFVPGTGGLLREAGLVERRRQAPAVSAGAPASVGLFCYPQAPIASLLDAFEHTSPALHCRIFQGPAQTVVLDWQTAHPGHRLTLEFLPWLSQEDFDRVLWSCDFNVVRGEDSFVRAQWAGRPFLWDIYPQDDDAHLVKMAAFLRCYRTNLADPAAAALGALWQPWVRRSPAGLEAGWQAVLNAWRPLTRHAEAWCEVQAARPDLLGSLLTHVAAAAK
jgi:uncharacterized repeat protein (TIGR03837 family)